MGGTGCGATPVVAKYFTALNIPVHVFAFIGFQDEVRGINNSLKFFKDLPDGVILHTIDNSKFLDFTKNYSKAEIGDITGDFIGNYAKSSSSYAYGGAIYNYASSSNSTVQIGDIIGDFIGNYVSTTGSYSYASFGGGAIYNESKSTIGNVTSNFINNSININYGGESYGGAIYNGGFIASITGDFIANNIYIEEKEDSSQKAYGGAIYNSSNLYNITGDFIGNYASSRGGAIYNYAYNSGSTAQISISGFADFKVSPIPVIVPPVPIPEQKHQNAQCTKVPGGDVSPPYSLLNVQYAMQIIQYPLFIS